MIAALLLIASGLAQDYAFPTSASDYGTFYPTAYYDHGGTDWNCGGIRYSGHRGNDFGVGSWSGMAAGRDIVAAADGVVTVTHDGENDQCTTGTCGTSNHVAIRHADGKVTWYIHMKTWSVAVSVGQTVTCGQYLGLAGSSGNSTGPHLHFQVNIGSSAYDPFDGPCSSPPSWWISQGSYNSLPGRSCPVLDQCPNDPNKTVPGVCGCGTPDTNSDGDGAYDCQETCDTDPNKTSPGVCGCGTPDTNADGDGAYDCQETCDTDPNKTEPGVCGCGTPDSDRDGDSFADCVDACADDPAKVDPGTCGCGLPEEDLTGDGVPDCTICGDGVLEAPETCDDGDRDAGDGCGALCQTEPLSLSVPSPGVAGAPNQWVVGGVPRNRQVIVLVSGQLGSTPIPGCPGLTVGLAGPLVVGSAAGDAAGQARVTRTVPVTVAGRVVASAAVDLAGCRVSPLRTLSFL
jgi:cysteine-rich repeat protein